MNVTAERAVYKNAVLASLGKLPGGRRDTLLREILAMDVKARVGEGRDLTRRMLYLPALIVAAVLMACAVVVLVVSEKAEATFRANSKLAEGVRSTSPTTLRTTTRHPTRPTARR